MKQWSEVQGEFEIDGSLRDIYVENIEAELWDHFLKEVKDSVYRIEFFHSDETLELPSSLSEIKNLQETDPTNLRIWLAGDIQINCHFFIASEIELDVSPREIQSEASYLELLAFLEWLSKSTKKEVKLTHEGAQELVIVSVLV